MYRLRGAVFSWNSVRGEIFGRQPDDRNATKSMAGLLFPGLSNRCRQSIVARRRMDREHYVRQSDRRSSPGPLSPPNWSRAELLLRTDARYVDEPDHGHVECRFRN